MLAIPCEIDRPQSEVCLFGLKLPWPAVEKARPFCGRSMTEQLELRIKSRVRSCRTLIVFNDNYLLIVCTHMSAAGVWKPEDNFWLLGSLSFHHCGS